MADESINKHPKSYTGFKKNRAGRSTKNVNLPKVYKKLKTILTREADHLLDSSYMGKLDKFQSDDLRGYLKLCRDLIAQEQEVGAGASEADLERLAAIPSKPKQS